MPGVVLMPEKMVAMWFSAVARSLPPAVSKQGLWLGVCEEHHLLGTAPTTEEKAQEWVDQHVEAAHTRAVP